MVIVRLITPMIIVCAWLPAIAGAQKALPDASTLEASAAMEQTQKFTQTVVPITSVKIRPSAKVDMSGKLIPNLGIEADFGTGFCLDPACRFIGTNYHVALATRADKIEREKIMERYFATGPDDEGAKPNYIPNVGVFPFAEQRDLAIFELRRALPHHRGLAFSLDELEPGQEVDIYGYPKGVVNPFRKLTRFPAAFKAPTASGLLAFEYHLSADRPLRIAGSSGGIVVDRKTEKIVGILSGTAETVALAVPVQTLLHFVKKVQPFLASTIFPIDAWKKFSPVSPDIYPKFLPARSDEVQHRPEEPAGVQALRQKAQLLADSIRNFIAVQSFAWGSGDKYPDAQAAYEVRVIGGVQTFRRYPDGAKELKSVPYPRVSGWATPYDEWSKLPKMVGTEYRLKVRQAPSVLMIGQQIKVFQYYASVEDNLCPFTAVEDFGFFSIGRAVAVACYGEVWTDEDLNIIRISERLDLSNKLKAYRGWEDFRVIVTYGPLTRPNEPPQLIPLTIYTEANDRKHTYWCRGHFTDYRVFSVRATLVAN